MKKEIGINSKMDKEIDTFEKNICNFISKQVELMKKHNQKHEEEIMNFQNVFIILNKYEKMIASMKEELNKLKEENNELKSKITIEDNNILTNKIISALGNVQNNQELIKLVSIVKDEVHKLSEIILGRDQHNLEDTKQLSDGHIKKLLNQSVSIQRLQHEIHLENIFSNTLYSPIELKDKRIACCSFDHSISIVSIDYGNKKWIQDIKKEKSHSDYVRCLCEIKQNILASCSQDTTVKIWEISKNDLQLLSTLSNHSKEVIKVITLTHNRFASCSRDNSVRIWSNESPYNEITTLSHEGEVSNLIQLKQKELLITSDHSNPSLDFWDLRTYKKINTIKGEYTDFYSQGMIELPNGLVAVSSKSSGNPIVIVDPNNYNIIKTIKDQTYITSCSSICVLDTNSFVYSINGKFIQISLKDNYQILFQTDNEKKLHGRTGLISVQNGKYLLITLPSQKGFSIIKPYY